MVDCWTKLIPSSASDCFVSGSTIIIGFYFLRTTYSFLKNCFVYFLAEPLGLTTNFRRLGEWAVVTGSTDGIGKAYALDLARRGCNIVLISRTEAKLREVSKEIEKKYPGVKTKIIVADFTAGEEIYTGIKKELSSLEIGTLVNNVGMTYPYPENFHDLPNGDKLCMDMIRCNIVAQTLMTRTVLPQMLKRRKGVIVGLSSAFGTLPSGMVAVYSATKAYNDFFSRSIEMELRDKGIIVQSITPFFVSTNMAGNPKSSLFIIDSNKFARSCLNSVGFLTATHGTPAHVFQNFLIGFIPEFLGARYRKKFLEKARLKKKAEGKGE